jgi:hypothetical protein
MAKRKKSEVPTGDSCAELIPRLEKLEKIVKEYFGISSLGEVEENPESDPVVEEKRYDRSVLRIHKSGKILRTSICPFCGTEVSDLAMHKATKHPSY